MKGETVGASRQYIKIDNRILSRKASGIADMSAIGMYALLSAFLGNPAFCTPGGGLRHAIERHCANGRYSLNGQWAKMYRAGYLKRARIPDKQGELKDFYALLPTADFEIPSVQNLTFREGEKWKATQIFYREPVSNYTPIPYQMLMDSGLTLAAKGLYMVIQRYLLIAARTPGVEVNQEKIRAACHAGATAFRRMWKELTDTGYLKLTRVWSKEHRGVSYRYTLLGGMNPEEEMTEASQKATDECERVYDRKAEKQQRVNRREEERRWREVEDVLRGKESRGSRRQAKERAPIGESPGINAEDRAWLREGIEEQIERETLIARGHAREAVDLIVDLIEETLLTDRESAVCMNKVRYRAWEVQEEFRHLEAEDIEQVLEAWKKTTEREKVGGFKIRYLRRYLLTCLFNARRMVREQMAIWGIAIEEG